MSLRIKSRLALILGLLLAGWLGYAYWQIRELDPEGGCKEMKYWSLCWNAWEDSWMSGLPWRFRALPTDQEMIDRFRKHHGDFEAMKDKAVKTSQGDIWREWEDTSGVYRSEPFASYPRTPEEKARHTSRTWAYSFRVEDTRYVKDASIQDLAMLMRTKGYVYFRSPPQIEDGYLRGLPGQPKYLFRVLPSLDGPPWPSDWKSGDCWLRQIEPQWFLALCRDRVGG